MDNAKYNLEDLLMMVTIVSIHEKLKYLTKGFKEYKGLKLKYSRIIQE